MSALGLPSKLEILLLSSLLLYSMSALLLIPFALIGLLPLVRKHVFRLIAICAILPGVILGSLSLLLVDNFTYTVFSFGIVTSQTWIRGIYGVLFLIAVALWWFYVTRKIGEITWTRSSTLVQKVVISGLVLSFLAPAPIVAYRVFNQHQRNPIKLFASGSRPNVLIITTDGLSATNLSVYGYERKTTPNLEKLARSSLVAENAFANASSTTGSLVSLYTSKSPFRTRVLYPPDVLRGADAYQHLPGILKSLGYYNAQFTVPHYADALTQNVLDGFDIINGRDVSEIGSISTFNHFMPINEANFIHELYQRLVERLGHIFYIADTENPYSQVTQPAKRIADLVKIRKSLKLLETSSNPVFIHIHLMGTHGPLWHPEKQIYSSGQDVNQQEPWNVDFYDDSIRGFDKSIGMMIKELTRKGLLENTIIIIGSDHGKKWDSLQRIPLLIRFPHGAHTGVIKVNVQNMDIAPTILDFLGLNKPEWMDGESLYKIGSTQRPIMTAMNANFLLVSNGDSLLQTDQAKVAPPFYQFSTISSINCQRWDQLWLLDHILDIGEIDAHTSPCREGDLIGEERAFNLFVDYLKAYDFDVSSLKDYGKISIKP